MSFWCRNLYKNKNFLLMIEYYISRGGMEYFIKENWIYVIVFIWINFNFIERYFLLSFGNGDKEIFIKG